MRIKKKYGAYRIDYCPFCGGRSTTTNQQSVPVCIKHKHKELLDLKCVCGDWLDLKKGKFGPYFNCLNCGNMSFSKALELNPQIGKEKVIKAEEKAIKEEEVIKKEKSFKKEPKEIQITSDDIGILY
jgi:hypothetical protein